MLSFLFKPHASSSALPLHCGGKEGRTCRVAVTQLVSHLVPSGQAELFLTSSRPTKMSEKHVWLNNNDNDDDNKKKKGRSDSALWFVLCEAVWPPRCCFAATSLLHFVM